MKLLVCDIEGTIFKPHMIKSAQHASYIWTAIAEALGKEAQKEEINTQKKWRDGGYGKYNTGVAYKKWVNDSIEIHKKYHLKKAVFDQLIHDAPYIDGVQRFFEQLNRDEYIPIFISGGIQNLNQKACVDLGVDIDDSYASCEYYFDHDGEIDDTLTFLNTCNFYGKQELINVALRKHGLGADDWIFIGDGINDVSVAGIASLAIGIAPIDELKEVVDYSFNNFTDLLQCHELLEEYKLIGKRQSKQALSTWGPHDGQLKERSKRNVDKQVWNLHLTNLEKRAYKRYKREVGDAKAIENKSRFFGIEFLLMQGEYILSLFEQMGETEIASAALQPFCSAAEIMVNVTLALTGRNSELHSLFNAESTLRGLIERIDNESLRTVLQAYRLNRNAIAHSCQVLPIRAGCSLARRTYENIQRLELIANPDNLKIAEDGNQKS